MSMHRQSLVHGWAKPLITLGITLASLAAGASPPPWAPAWGHRGHAPAMVHHHHYYPSAPAVAHAPYPVYPAPVAAPYYAPPPVHPRRGRNVNCGEPLFGGALGGALGGFAGSRIGRGDGQLAATAAGTLLGYAVGTNVAGRCRPWGR